MTHIQTTNPATEGRLASYQVLTHAEVTKKLHASAQAQQAWKHTSHAERADLMRALATHFADNVDAYANLITTEMGKVITQAKKEVEKCAWVCRYYADNTATMLADVPIATESSKSYACFEPLGVVLAVMPWNFPFYQVMRCAAPIIIAGNAVVLKHASNVQGSAAALEHAFTQSGFPDFVLTNLTIKADDVKQVIEHDAIAAVTLTGSDVAGRAVASIAGQSLKKTVLELGGTDAYLVLEDVDLEQATDLALFGRLQNTGQTCIAAKRLIVLDEVYDAFVELLHKKMQAATMGNPLDITSYYGPMARVDLRDELHEQVQLSINQGAHCLLGGQVPQQKGAWYPATLLVDVKPNMEAFESELFGPVAVVVRANDETQAISLANQSRFGLGSGVLTGNVQRGERIAHLLEAGNSFVNSLVASDPRLPFGGIKNSGYGRELSTHGVHEFVNVKTISIA